MSKICNSVGQPNPGSVSEAFTLEQLFEENYARLVHFSFQMIGEIAQAEDIAQEAFIQYWKQKEEVSSCKIAVKCFLYSSVKNACLNAIRHQKVIHKYRNQPNGQALTEPDVVHAMIRSEVLSELHRAMDALPEACQKISRMGFLDGKKNQEIAEELGISVNTVKTQKQRGLHLLRGKLKPEFIYVLALLIID